MVRPARALANRLSADPSHSRARARGGTTRLPLGRLHPHAGGADVPDRQPLLRLEVRVGAGAAHGRAADLPRPRQGARRLVEHQRDDLPARQPARLRALGRRSRDGRRGTTPTACRTSSGWRRASPAATSSAATPGRCVLERGPVTNPLFGAFFEAVQQAGYPLTDDVNGYRQEGFAAFDRNVHRGRRLSAARAYLHPVMDRPNLDVRCRALVTRLVTARHPRHRRRVPAAGPAAAHRSAAGEVILCGGAFNSPQLLQVSGIGDADHLRSVGVTPVHHLPGVGEHLQDHLEVYVQHASTQPVSLNPLMKWRHRPWIGLQWLAPPGPRRVEPLRGRRVHPQQRRRRLPQPDVPLPADRGALRRQRRPPAGTATRCTSDRCTPTRAARCGSRRPTCGSSRRCGSTTCRPTRTDASGSRRSAPPARSSASRRSRRSTAASCRPVRPSRPTSEILDWVAS